jgi:hypothetical protein
MEIRGKGKPIFCRSDGEWKDKLEKCLQTDNRIVLLALGDVKYEVLSYLNRIKATVRSRSKPDNLQKL